MILGKLIEYGQDLSDVLKVWNQVFIEDKVQIELEWNEEIAIYGVIHDADNNPLAAGKLIFTDNNYVLDKIGVIESERKKGYGDFLVRLLVNKAFMSGAECVYVNISFQLVEFYKKFGFRAINEKNSIQEKVNMILFTSSICRKCSKM